MYEHGGTGTRIFRIWQGMRARCTHETSGSYVWYGAKGIKVCTEWDKSFVAFRDWAYANGYDDTLTLDRIDSSKDYSPSNCRWTTMKKQQNNRCNNHMIKFNGEEHTLTEWAEIIGLSPKTLSKRLCDGWSVEKALTQPLNLSKSHIA